MKQTILLMVDTQRQDMLSCYDKTSAKTPNIDSLCDNGTKYTNANTCQPVCGPARSALFTGLFPHSNGMTANCMQLGENIKNAGQWLSEYNIACAYIGKWHLDGGDYFGYGKCPDGYIKDYWYDMRNFLEEFSDEERLLSRKNMTFRTDDPKEEDTYAHRCTDRAIKFVEEFKDKDFFLTLSFDEPHDPSTCPKRFFKELDEQKFVFHKTPNIKASLKNKPEHHKVWAKPNKMLPFFAMQKAKKSFFACNVFCDYEFGRLLKKLKELNIEPMIVYTADHGDMLLSHGIMNKGPAMYNEITKVPLIISGGGFEKCVNQTPVSHIDILPTIMDYFGVPIPPMLQGEPIKNIPKDKDRDVFIEFTRYENDHDGFMGFQPIRCIVNKEYKLVINLLTSDELYDLKADPYEMNNLINNKKYAKIRNELHDRLIMQMNVSRDVFRGYYWDCRPWRSGKKPSVNHTGYTRQLVETDFTQLDYSTGLPVSESTRKK